MRRKLSLMMIFLIAFSTISFAMPKARAETEFPRPTLPDGPTHTNELVEVITANTTKVLIVTEGWGPLTGVSPIEEKDFWINVLSEMSGDFDVDWFDGVPSFEKLNDYDLVIYDAGGYWYPLSHVATPLRQYHFTGKPLIVVTPDINYDWYINGEPVPSFTRDVLHVQGVLGIMPEAVYDVYADTGHEIVYGIPKDVGIGVPAVTSWPDCFEPKVDCDSVLRQSYIPETEFGVGTCSGLPSYSPYDPAGKLFAFVAYPGSDTEGRVVTYGIPISGLENTKIAKQLATATIEWALQEELLDIDITLYIEDADAKTLVNKAPGDKIDIVASILNNEETQHDVDVVFEVPSDLSFDKGFTRDGFGGTDEKSVTPTIDENEYTVTISLEAGKSKQVILRFDISESASTGSKLVSATTKVDGKLCSSTTVKYNTVANVAAIVVTNRHLLYEKYDSTEVKSLLKYLFEIADGNSGGEVSCIVYYVDHYDEDLKSWDQDIDYTSEATANQVADTIDPLVESWDDQSDPEYIMIVGGDEIIPFYRLDDSNYYDTADNDPYNSNDPVLHTFDENYFLSDNPYADTSGNDYDIGEIELSIGRIVGYTASEMQGFIKAGIDGPNDLEKAVVASWEGRDVDDIIDALDRKNVDITEEDTLTENDDWTETQLRNALRQGFQIFCYMGHGEYNRTHPPGTGTLYANELDDIDSNGCFSTNRPLIVMHACRTGVVTDEDEDQWNPEWDDCMLYSLVSRSCSGILAPGAKAISVTTSGLTGFGEQLINDFMSRLITDDGESLQFGTALRNAKAHYDPGLGGWEGGDRKTVTEYIYFGAPWTTIDPQTSSDSEDNTSVSVDISNPDYMFDNTFCRIIEVNVTDYSILSTDGYDLIVITGAQLSSDAHKPTLPYKNIELRLPLDSNVVDLVAIDSVATAIGEHNIPSVVPAEAVELGGYEQSTGKEFYPSPIYSMDTSRKNDHKVVSIKTALIQYNPETRETVFFNCTKLRITYQTDVPIAIYSFLSDKTEYDAGETINVSVVVENIGSEGLTSLYVDLALKDCHGQIVATALSASFGLEPGETSEMSILLDQELQHGTYLLEAEVIGSVLATFSTFISVLTGEIVDFNAPAEVKLEDDAVFEVSFFNGKSMDVYGETVIYVYDPNDIEIAELYSSPTTFPAASITQTQITWNTAGKECGTYTASAVVDAGGEFFGPVHHLFSIKPPDEIPPTTSLTIGSPQYVDALDNVYINSSTTLTLNAIDDGGTGSGVALTGYKIYDTSYDSGWITGSPPISFQIGGLDDGLYYVDYNSTDNVGNIEKTNTTALILDNTGPLITVSNPPAGWALQDGVTFLGSIIDDSGSGVFSMSFSIREANDGEGTPIGFEDLPASYDPGTGEWSFFFDTLLVPDGYYVLYIEAEDNLGNKDSTTVPYSIRNWAVMELLPSSEDNKAGRTMPVKFALRVVAEVDPNQPFVYNEELRIEIYGTDNPSEIQQESYFGDTARDYRISSVLYITNFKTLKRPMEYAVTVYRDNFDVGSFTFETVK